MKTLLFSLGLLSFGSFAQTHPEINIYDIPNRVNVEEHYYDDHRNLKTLKRDGKIIKIKSGVKTMTITVVEPKIIEPDLKPFRWASRVFFQKGHLYFETAASKSKL